MQNFGKIKNSFNVLLSESISTKNDASKKLFKKYIQTIKESEILRTQFLVISNIEGKIESDKEKANQFVKENISLFSGFNKKDILEANKKLSSLVTLNEDSYKHKELHENITKLIFTKRTPNNIDMIIETTSEVVDYILNNEPKEVSEIIDLPSSMISTMMIDKYNEKYSTLDESEKKILKSIINSTDEEKKEVYISTMRECIDLIDSRVKEADLDAKDKLLRVKDKLLNDKLEINEEFTKNISKLVDLKNSLNNN